MNTIQLRKLIDNAPLLKVGDRASCETLMKSIKMDLEEMNSGCRREHILFLSGMVDSRKREIIAIIESA